MKTFREYALSEALKIVKRASDNPVKKPQSFSTKKKVKLPDSVSYFDNCEIIRTTHSKEIRDGELGPRDEGLKDALILKTVKKAWKKGLKPDTKTIITYKNKKKKYDLIVVEWKIKENKIVIVTVIQDNNNSPKDYYTNKHKNDPKIMTENIIKDFHIEDIINIIF